MKVQQVFSKYFIQVYICKKLWHLSHSNIGYDTSYHKNMQPSKEISSFPGGQSFLEIKHTSPSSSHSS